MKKLYFYGFILLMLFPAGKGFGQLSPYEHQSRAPDVLSPLFLIKNGLNGLFSGDINSFGLDQSWDSVQQHFRGRILTYLYYPEIRKQGVSSFTIQNSEVYYNRSSHYDATPEEMLRDRKAEAESRLQKDNGRRKNRYYLDDSGWICARTETAIFPGNQYFSEGYDTLNYVFSKDGSVIINRIIQTHASGSRHNADNDCDTMPGDLFQKYERLVSRIIFDKWHNITTIETHMETRWGNCTVGEQEIWSWNISYDSIGRPILLVVTNGAYPSKVLEVSYQYYRQPFQTFLDTAMNSPAYQSLALPDVSVWLKNHAPLTYLLIVKTSKNYLRYERETRQNVFYPDSPEVRQQFSHYIINKAKQRVIAWDNPFESGLEKDAFILYSYAADTENKSSVKEMQYLPYGISKGKAAELSGAHFCFTDTQQVGAFKMISFKTGEKSAYRPANYSRYSWGDVGVINNDPGTPHLFFNPQPKPLPFGNEIQSVWIKNGLVNYLWTDNYVYKLTYYKNEP